MLTEAPISATNGTNGNGTEHTVRVQCQASHPDPKRHGRCGAVLGDIPAPAQFVGTSARRPTTPDGRIRLQCSRRDCRTWNVFEPVSRG